MAIVAIAAESVYGMPLASNVGLTDFCQYFQTVKGGCSFWGVALLAAGQSSAITTTFTGQYIMDGFLHLRLPVWKRAVTTRLVAILPCIIVSAAFPSGPALNKMVNIVNSSISVLLPFALTPLVKYNCSVDYLGEHVASRYEQWLMLAIAFGVWLVNAVSLSAPGAGFLGFTWDLEFGWRKLFWIVVQIVLQVVYAGWNAHCLARPVSRPMRPLQEERPYVVGEFPEAWAPPTTTNFVLSASSDGRSLPDDNQPQVQPSGAPDDIILEENNDEETFRHSQGQLA